MAVFRVRTCSFVFPLDFRARVLSERDCCVFESESKNFHRYLFINYSIVIDIERIIFFYIGD